MMFTSFDGREKNGQRNGGGDDAEATTSNNPTRPPLLMDKRKKDGKSHSSMPLPDEDDDLPLLLTTETSTDGTGTEEGSSAMGDDERWLELELEMLERMSVRTQTVEEILAEKNDFPLDDDDILFASGPGQSMMEDGCSSAAATGLGTQLPPMGRYGAIPTELPNTYQLDSPLVLRREDSISRQLPSSSSNEHPDRGHSTVICVGHRLLAVGTSHGHCLFFEKTEPHRLVHSVHPGNNAFGAISCLDFSPDQSRLCIGFSMGAILIFRCQGTGRIIFSSNDVIQPGKGILHVKYISTHSLLIVDNGGNVYEFHERKLGKSKNNVRCIFTGCKGEVTNIAFVNADNGVELLVLATFYQALLLSVKRRGATVGQIRLHGSPLFPPLIDWRERKQTVTSHTVVRDLRICIARDQEGRIYQVRQRVGGDLLFPLVQILRFPAPQINLKWIDDWTLLGLSVENGAEQLNLIELPQAIVQEGQRKTSTNQHVLATSSAVQEIAATVQLVYNSADFKGLATGRNVSQAMQNLADSICYQSMARYHSEYQVYLLGQNGIFAVYLLEQNDQLKLLIERGDFASALLFAVDICSGRVRDRTKHGGSFRARTFRDIPSLVNQLLEQTIDGLESGRIDELIAHYKRNFYVLIRACVITSHFDLLYNTVYARVQKDCLCRSIFLELLEEFVLEGQLDQPPPTIVNDYLNYLLNEGQLPQFEQSITKLPVECMDLHQVTTACREHQLFDGICYVFNNAMRNYISPLAEMFDHMQRFMHKEVLSDLEIAQGNKLLLYLNCCLAGRAYPYGELPDEHLAQTVPLETYKFLVQLRPSFTIAATPSPSPSTDDGCSPGPSSANIDNQSVDLRRFPHLNLLLRFDAQQFLNVISTCADAPVFSQCEGRLKRLVDVLVSKCVEDDDSRDVDLRNELGPLLITFVNGLLQKGSIPKDVFLITRLIEWILERRFSNLRAKKAAEQGIVELLRSVPEIELDQVLHVAQKMPHVHICAYIYTVRKEYVHLLECCLQDPIEPLNVFPILSDLLLSLHNSDQQAELGTFVRKQLPRLSALDAQQSAQLVLGNFPELLMECRAQARKLPLPFLQQCFKMRREQGYKTLTGGEEEQDEQLFDYFFEGTIQSALNTEKKDSLDLELVDQLRYWLPLGALSDHCLNVSMQQPNGLLLECSAILLVTRGHIQRAFEQLFNEGILKSGEIGIAEKNQEGHDNRPQSWRMERCVGVLLELAGAYPTEARQGNWMPKLFRHLLTALGTKGGKSADGEAVYTQFLRPDSHLSRVFTAIMEQQHHEDGDDNAFPMVSLISELFSNPVLRNAPFHAFQNLLRQMLLWCEIRTVMQRSTRDCIGWELTERWQKIAWKKGVFAAASIQGVAPPPKPAVDDDPFLQSRQQMCLKCGQRIFKSFFLFPCGHCIHLECTDDAQKRCPCEHKQPSSLAIDVHCPDFLEDGQSQSSSVNRADPSDEERRIVSAIFRRLERDFQLRTGPPPPKAIERKQTERSGGRRIGPFSPTSSAFS